jgi:Sulfotransferase family
MNVLYGILLGCPRSGTSFLMDALETLPRTECISGRIFPLHIAHIVNQELIEQVRSALMTAFQFSLNFHLRTVQTQRLPALEKWCRGAMNFSELVQAMSAKREFQRLIFKEPFLAFAPDFAYESIPESKIIHIYRDGRDCADSLVRSFDAMSDSKLTHLRSGEMPIGRKYNHLYVPWWVENGREDEFIRATPYIRSIWMWKKMVGRCHEFFSRPDVAASGRVLQLKYEDFVSDPKRYGETISNHMGSTMTGRFRKYLNRAVKNSIGVHARTRSQKEIEEAQRIARKELEIYGYL